LLYAIVPAVVIGYQRRKTNPGILAFNEALRLHRLHKIAAHEAAQEQLKLKRSYWEGLNGYEFEIATAEVLKKHHFNTSVTRGSGDGGIDINAARGGFSGVVQCKAHVASAGPHVVRDLWGVIHPHESGLRHHRVERWLLERRSRLRQRRADLLP